MKKHLLCAGTFLASSFAAFAGALNTTGVPASAEGILHIDFEATSKSKIGQVTKLCAALEKAAESKREDYGLALMTFVLKNTSDITIAAIPNPEGKNGAPKKLVIQRGNFPQKKFLSHIEKLKFENVTIGKHTFFKVHEQNAGIVKTTTTTAATAAFLPPHLVCSLDANTLVYVDDEKTAVTALAALSGKAKSYTAPASLTKYGKRVGSPFVLLYLNEKVFPKRDPAQPKNAMDMTPPSPSHVFFALGEDAKNIKARLAATYATAADVQKTQALAQMAIEMARGGLANPNGRDGKPDPKKAEECAKMTKVLNALKITTAEPNYFTLSLDYPAEEIIQHFKDINARENAASSKK